MISKETFPGVYATISEEIIQPTLSSRFRAGVIGIASKGPMNTPTSVPTAKSQQAIFGIPVEGYTFGPTTVAVAAEFSDGSVFTRVGKQYLPVADDGSSTTIVGSGYGVADPYKIYTTHAAEFSIGDYIRVVQAGKSSTVNAKVVDYIPSGNAIDPVGLLLETALADTYTYGVVGYVDRSTLPNAASNAETFLYSLDYGTNDYSESAGFVKGDKSGYTLVSTGIVGPQIVDTLEVASGVATVTLDAGVTSRFKVGEIVHIANAAIASVNGSFTLTAVDYNLDTITFNVPAQYGPDILLGTAVSGGYAQVTVTPGATYDWTKGGGETLLVNGGSTLSASDQFVAEGDFVRVYEPGPTATGNLKIIDGAADQIVAVAPGAAAITVSILEPGDVIRISQSGLSTTFEAMVKEVSGGNIIKLYNAPVTETGYQPVTLQASYTAGTIAKVQLNDDGTFKTNKCMHLIAASSGTWANSDGQSTGLWVRVSPGSAAGSKKILVYDQGSLVETIDNLSLDSTSADYYVTRINGVSTNIAVLTDLDGNATGILINDAPPANTMKGWSSTAQQINFATFGTGGNAIGYNGELAEFDDYVGSYDEVTDRYTGLRAFLEEGSSLGLTVVAAPGVSDYAVQQELINVGLNIHAEAILDHPKGINGRQIVDWSNGTGKYPERALLDSWHGALVWNWVSIKDPFTGDPVWVPPSVGMIRQMAYTAANYKLWYAPAGENHGVINIAGAVEFPHVSKEAKSAMYGGGQAVNPILLDYGKIMVYGNRTLYRSDKKLSDLSVALLLKHIIRSMSIIGRKYIFDPNDPEMLSLMFTDFKAFFEGLKSDRGLETYTLKMDAENNTAEVRNQRSAVCDFSVVPYGTFERLYINATVKESGATINTIQ